MRCESLDDAKALKHFFSATTRRLPRRSMPFQTMPYAPRPRRPQTSMRRCTRRSTCSLPSVRDTRSADRVGQSAVRALDDTSLGVRRPGLR